MALERFRQQYPEYDQIPDDELAERLYTKHYNHLDRNDYYQRIGVTPKPTAIDEAAEFSTAPERFEPAPFEEKDLGGFTENIGPALKQGTMQTVKGLGEGIEAEGMKLRSEVQEPLRTEILPRVAENEVSLTTEEIAKLPKEPGQLLPSTQTYRDALAGKRDRFVQDEVEADRVRREQEGVMGVIPPMEKHIIESGQELSKYAQQVIKENPEWQRDPELVNRPWHELLQDERTRGAYLARALGENVPNLAGGVIASGVGGMLAGPEGVMIGAGLFTHTLETGFSYEELKKIAGSDEAAAETANAVGAVNALLETVPIANLFQRVPGLRRMFLNELTQEVARKPFIRRAITEGLRQAAIEGTTEGLQEIVANVGKQVYNKNQDLFEGVSESVFIGALMGKGMGAGGQVVDEAIHQINQDPAPDEPIPNISVPRETGPTPDEVQQTQQEESTRDLQEFVNDPRPTEEVLAERAETRANEAEQAEAQAQAGELDAALDQAAEQGQLAEEFTEEVPVVIGEIDVDKGTGDRTDPVKAETPQDVDQAAIQSDPEPTEGQKEAGNYKKGHVKLHGLDITIENARGDIRSGTDPNGEPWEVTMPAHYGYVKKTKGADGDHVDVYIGEQTDSKEIFVVDQIDPDTGKFDEHKIILGTRDQQEAAALYDAGFSDERGRERMGAISRMSLTQFRQWLKNGNTKKPFAYDYVPPDQMAAELQHVNTWASIPDHVRVDWGVEAGLTRRQAKDAAKSNWPDIRGSAIKSKLRDLLSKKRKHQEALLQEGEQQPDDRRAAPHEGSENRRIDEIMRKEISEMTDEEKNIALRTDELTGLGNYRAFKEHRKNNNWPHVIYFDIDDFKTMNTEHGHLAADRIMRYMAETARDRQNDSLEFFRRSGDEFLGVSNLSAEETQKIMQEIQEYLYETGFELDFKDKDGNPSTVSGKGVGLSYGIGQNEQYAEERSDLDKQRRKDAGKRLGQRDADGSDSQESQDTGPDTDRDQTLSSEEEVTQSGVLPPEQQKGQANKRIAKLLHQMGLQDEVMQGEDFHRRIKNPPYMDLVIERHMGDNGDQRIYFTHYYEQNGDLILDGEMVYAVKDGRLDLVETAVMASGRELRNIDATFANMFAKNLLDQGFGEALNKPDKVDNTPDKADKPEQKTGQKVTQDNLYQAFAGYFSGGLGFKTIQQARKFASDALGEPVKPGTPLAKFVDEQVELGVVIAARKIVEQGEGPRVTYGQLVNLYQRQPNLSTKTSTSVAQQAYSTPAPIAYLASRLADINKESSVYEPSAGNGMLLIETGLDNAIVNELNPDRAKGLRNVGFAQVTENDATTHAPDQQVDTVIANPPFGVVKIDGVSKRFQIDDRYSTTEIDHAISLKSLESMHDEGSAVLIVGSVKADSVEKRSDGYNGKAKRAFYKTLYDNYNVVEHFSVDGSLYSRQGAGWPIDIIVIRGRGKSNRKLPAADVPKMYHSFDELEETLHASYQAPRRLGAQNQQARRPESGGRDQGQSTADGSGRVPEPASRPSEPDADGRRGSGGSTELSDRPAGESGTDAQNAVSDTGDGGQRPGVQQSPDARASERDGNTDTTTQESGQEQSDRTPSSEGNQSAQLDQRTDNRPVKKRPRTRAAEGVLQVEYQPQAKGETIGTLVPVNMQSSTQDALERLESQSGDINQYVAEKLQYKVEDLPKYFAAEQIDAIALALQSIGNGSGFIIGDQTGIGKGRVVAAIIRYAMKNGKTPIFVTEKPNLYADMIRDLNDIGMSNINALMTNSGEKVPLDEDGNHFLRSKGSAPHNAMLTKLANDGDLGDYEVIFTTYNQMQTVKGAKTARMDFLEAFAQGGVMIFDESHNAGGTGEKKRVSKGGKQFSELDRAQFARNLIGIADAVFYSSATYAKRPQVMDLYSKTDMRLAVADPKDLPEAIAKGGVPLQQVVASMLADAGQYIRRERSFEGIRYDTQNVNVNTQMAEKVSRIMRDINVFDDLKGVAVETIKEDIKTDAMSVLADGSIGKAGASSTNFTAIMHNLIDQLLLSLKAQAASDIAIEALKNNEKPVITVANTMGSFIQQYTEDMGLTPGDVMDLDFGQMLDRYLERSREILEGDAYGKKKRRRLTDEELGPTAVAKFNQIKQLIQNSDFSELPVSPIDYIKWRIEAAGYKVGEITGRQQTINYSSPEGPTYKLRNQKEISILGRRKSIDAFNSGKLDVLILNRAGSTGLSLHASEKFSDQRARVMIIAQAEANIDTHMQMLGRINRTGQVEKPRYIQMVAGIPAEKRPASVLSNKMASLNANTTASRDSAVTAKDVPDFMNQYGDLLAAQVMEDDIETHLKIGAPLKQKQSGTGLDPVGAMRKVTGRIPLLPIKEQEEIYERLETEYSDFIQRLEAMGENALEAKTLELDAKPVSKTVVHEGTSTSSPFAADAHAEILDIKRIGKPYSSEKLIELLGLEVDTDAKELMQIARHGNTKSNEMRSQVRADFLDYKRSVLDDIADEKRRETQEKRLDGMIARLDEMLRGYAVGTSVKLMTDLGNFYGVVLKIEHRKGAKNPAALGTWRFTIAVSDAVRQIQIPASKLYTNSNKPDIESPGDVVIEPVMRHPNGKPILTLFDEAQSESREKRTIITGNLLAGFGRFKKGQIVNFRTHEGEIKQGIMMPRDFDTEKAIEEEAVELMTGADVVQFIGDISDDRGMVFATDKAFSVRREGGRVRLAAAASKAQGGRYFLDTDVLKVIGQDFVKAGQYMRVIVDEQTARKVVDIYRSKGVRFVTEAYRAEARDMLKKNKPKYSADKTTPKFTENRDAVVTQVKKLVKIMAPMAHVEVVDRLFGEGPGLKLSGAQGSEVAGAYHPGRNLIEISLSMGDVTNNVQHEVIHALKDMGLFRDSEWKLLSDQAEKQWKADYGVEDTEEAIAYAFGDWRAKRGTVTDPVAKLFRRIKLFMVRLGNLLKGRGFKTVDDIFESVASGEVGQRDTDTGSGDTRYSAAKSKETFPGFDVTDETLFNYLVQKVQDRMRRVKVVQKDVEQATGEPLQESENPYLQEELFYGRTEARLKDFEHHHIEPLIEKIREAGVDIRDVDEYLYAKHAPERNAAIAEIRPEFVEEDIAGSGMSDAEAEEVLAKYEERGQADAMGDIAEMVYAINQARIDLLRDAGLVNEETADLWEEKYNYYVPLRGSKEHIGRHRIGRGFDIRGKESKRALGRRSRADSPLSYSIAQMEETLIRAEKNRVGQAFLRLVVNHPNKDLWKIIKPKAHTKPRFNAETREVEYGPDPLKKLADNVMSVKVQGKEYYIEMQDESLARSMKNIGAETSSKLIRGMAAFNRYLAMINTSLNPEFVLSNFSRDIQTAMINLVGEQEAKGSLKEPKQIGRKVLKDIPKVLKGVYLGIRNPDSTNEWAKWFKEYEAAGGKVGFFGLEDIKAKEKKLKNLIKEAESGKTAAVRRLFRFVHDWVMDVNGAVENAVRVAAYAHARKAGISKAKAASLAKNLTVNFNRKGEIGSTMNALYLFFNAGLQGSVRLIYAVRSRRVQAILGGIVAGSMMLAELNRMIGGDDDDDEPYYDKIPDHVRQRNLILMNPLSDTGDYFKFPLPYGYNVPYVIGENISGVVHGRDKAKASVHMIDTLLESFNPMGTEDSTDLMTRFLKMVSPTTTDPFLQMATNENFTGNPIMPENRPYGAKKPDSQRYWSTVSPVSKAAAEKVNSLTGGNKGRPGLVDISPESIDHMVEFFTGGVGRFIVNTIDTPILAIKEGEVPYYKIPVVRRFYSEQSEWGDARLYYENRSAMEQLLYESKVLRGDEDKDKFREFKKTNKELLKLRQMLRLTEGKIRTLRKQKVNLEARQLDDKVRKERQKKIDQRIKKEQQRFNKRYNRAVDLTNNSQ